MKRIITSLILIIGLYLSSSAQVLTNMCESRSACNARPVCSAGIIVADSSFATAAPFNVNPTGAAICGAFAYTPNWVYYRINSYTAGILNFTITANDPASDLDWALWDVTTAGCAAIHASPGGLIPVACNAAGTGLTGIQTGGLPAANFSPNYNTTAGGVYILGIARATGGTAIPGFNINFAGTTASLSSANGPALGSIIPINVCDPVDTIKVKLTKSARCSNIGITDFLVNGVNPTTASGANCNPCTNAAPNNTANYSSVTDTVILGFNPPLAPGSYTLSLNTTGTPFFDICGGAANTVPTLSFTVGNYLKDSIRTGFNCATQKYVDTIYAVGGTGPYQYKGNGGALTNVYGASTMSYNVFTNLSGGQTYTLTAKDASGCVRDTIITHSTVLPLQAPNLACSKAPPCHDQFSLDTIKVCSQIGGVPPYTFSIATTTPGATTGTQLSAGVWQNLQMLGGGTYTVTTTDAYGCTVTGTKNLTNPPVLTIPSITSTNPLCFGDSTGTLSTLATGGTFPYSYSISPFYNPPMTQSVPSPTVVWNNVPAGTFTVTVTDANLCTASLTKVVTSNSAIVIKTTNAPLPVTFVNPTCTAPCSGTITPYATGGAGGPSSKKYYKLPVTVAADSVNAGGSFTGLCQGTYTIMAKDAVGCTTTAIYTLSLPPIPDVVIDSVSNVLCNGGCSGKIYTTTTGGTTPYSYAFTPLNNLPCGNATTFGVNDYQNLPAGTYKVVVTSPNQCKDSALNIVITEPPVIVFDVPSIDDATCFGYNDGEIEVEANGGTGTITYTITPLGPQSNTNGEFSNLTAQCYTITATDANLCTKTTVVCVGQPTVLTLMANIDSMAKCFGDCNGGATATAGGGTLPYTYSINNGGIIDPQAGIATGLCNNTYIITVSDDHSCTKTTSVNITQPPVLTITNIDTTEATCVPGNDGTATVFVSGGTTTYTYSSDGVNFQAGSTLTGLSVGNHTATVKDTNGCLATLPFIITQAAGPAIAATIIDSVDCFGGSDGSVTVNLVPLTGTPGYQYSINGCNAPYQTSNVFSGLPAGNYTVCVKDTNSCTASSAIVVSEPAVLSASAVQDSVDCNGTSTGQITITGTGGSPVYQYSINNCATYQASNVFSNVAAGTYTVCVKDIHNCTATTTIDVLEPTVLSASAVQDSVDCFGTASGSITVSGSGGSPIYQYSIDNCATYQAGSTFNSLAAGTYTVCVKDIHNCTATTTIDVLAPTQLTVSAVQDSVDCNGTATGSITVTAGGGTQDYSYSIDNCATYQASNVFNNLTAGQYTVCVKDYHSCTVTTVINVLEPTPVDITNVTLTVATCSPGNDGTATVTVTGGTPGYTYAYDANAFQAGTTLGGMSVGTHTVYAKDQHGCLDSNIVNIVTANGPVIAATIIDSVDCFGGSDGSVTVNLVPLTGTPGYQYSINGCNAPYQTSNVFSGLPAGNYTVCVKDTNSCTASSAIVVSEPAVLSASAVQDSVDCNGTSTGQITITGTGGSPVYQYSINNCATYQASNVFSNVAAGTYTVCVKDIHNCTATTTIDVLEPTVLSASAVQDSVDCFGTASGSITVSGSGGSPIYQYSIDNCATYQAGSTFNSLAAGTYTVCVKDIHNCTATTTIDVLAPTQLTVSAVQDSVDCNGTATGSITVTAGGGTQDYSYSIDNCATYQASNVFNNLTAGQYTVCVKDYHSCTVTTVINVLEPTPVDITNVTLTVATCSPGNDGTATVTVTGGTPGYTYAYDANAFQAGTTLGGMSVGTHTVYAKDQHGCLDSNIVNIVTANGPVIAATIIDSVDCFGGSDGSVTVNLVPLTGTPGYQYSINGCNAPYQTSNVFSGLPAGNYTVCVKDTNSCTASSAIVVSEPAVLSASAVQDSVDCNGTSTGQITITGTGGSPVYQYSINNCATYQASNVFSNVAAGTYTVCVKDIHNCTATTTIDVLEPTVLSASAVQDSVDCFGTASGSITVSGTGGSPIYQYSIDNCATYQAGSTFNSLAAGTYTVCVKDIHNCTATTTIDVLAPTQLTVSAVQDSVDCNGTATGSITVTAGGGTQDYSYSIDNCATYQASNVFNNLTAGQYTVCVKDYHNCTVTTVINVLEPTPVDITNVTLTVATCSPGNDGTATVTVTGGTPGYTYAYDANAFQAGTTLGGMSVGTHTVYAKDQHGCLDSNIVNIVTANGPVIAATIIDSVDCFGGSDGSVTVNLVPLTGTPGYQYSINGCNAPYQTSNVFSGLPAGNYTVCVKDTNSCTASSAIVVSEPAVLSASAVQDSVDCNGTSTGQITITGTGGSPVYQYSINNCATYQASNVFSNVAAGTYTVCVKDIHNCTATTTIDVLEPTVLSASAVQDSVDCFGTASGSITVSGSGGSPIYQYSIDNCATYQAGSTFNSLAAGTYTVCVKDIHNCTATTTIDVLAPTQLTVSAVQDSVDCNGTATGSITVTAGGGTQDYSYSIDNCATYQASNVFNNLTAGQYTVCVKDYHSCTVTTVINVLEPTPLTITGNTLGLATCSPGNDGKDTITATGGTLGYTYAYDANAFQASNILTGLSAGSHTVYVKDLHGCMDSATIVINTANGPTASVGTTTNPTCSPGCDGTAVINVLNGTQPYTYTINNSGAVAASTTTSGLATTLCQNVLYTITVQDANQCTVATTVQLSNAAAPILTLDSTHNATCSPGCDGQAYFTPSAGAGAPYNYSISPAGPTTAGNVINGLCASVNYTIVLSDANGCKDTVNVQVGTANGPVLTLDSTHNASCSPGCDGKAYFTPSAGGGAPYSYSISPAGPTAAGNVINGLCASTNYTIVLSDANGCKDTVIVQVGTANGPVLTLDSTHNASCSPGCDGEAFYTVSGGNIPYTYAVSGTATTSGNLMVQSMCANINYTVTVTDNAGCTASNVAQVGTALGDTISVISFTDAGCNPDSNGTATLSPAIGMTYSVSPSQGTSVAGNVVSGLAAGQVYTITGTDAQGCTNFTTVQVGTTPSPTVSITSITNPNAAGATNGSIVALGAGGTPGYTYSINPNTGVQAPPGTFTGLGANCYTITVQDAKGCTATVDTCLVEPGACSVAISNPTDVNCFGGNDGGFTATGSGGVAPFTYTMNLLPGNINVNTGVATNLTAGTYIVTATDAGGGCAVTASVTISQPTALVINPPVIVAPSCVPGCDGSITVTATGGTPAYTYSIASPAGSTCNVQQPSAGNFTQVGTGTYTITVKDSHNCQTTLTVSVAPVAGPVINNLNVTNLNCFGVCTGQIVVNATNTTLYSLTSSSGPFAASNTFTNLCANNYTVYVINGGGCIDSVTTNVSQPPVLAVNNVSAASPLCNGQTNGTITVGMTGGTPNYNFTITPLAGVQAPAGTFTGLAGGTYTIHACDTKGCCIDTVITLVNPTAVVWDTVGHNNISCSGANNGSIYADASGGTNPIEYRLNAQPYGATQTFNNLTPAIYTITAKDANGCTISTTVTIVEPPILTLTPPTKVDVLCNGANTGSISTSANGGTPGSPNAYTFSLTPGGGSNSTGSFTSLTAGTYTVTVTDGAGCTKSATVNISQPPAIVFTQVNSQNVNCFGQATGSITVSSQGGAGGITYSANPLIFPGQQTTPGFFENLYANLYTITATDVNGCSISTQVSVTQNSPLSVNSVVMIEPICNGDANGSIEITSAGGGVPPYSYALNGGNFQTSALFGNLVAAPYIITLKDALGCTRDTILNLTQPLPVSGLINTTNANCVDSKDGKVIVIGTGGRGGYKYYVTPGLFINKSGIFSGLEANTYTLRVVDTAGCEYQTTFTINPPANPLNSVMTKTDLGCYGYGNEGMATANVSGGAAPYTYMWSTDPVQTDATAKSLYFGFYTVDITDVNGCVIRDSVYIEEGPCCDFSFIPNAFSPNGDRNNDEFRVLTSAGVILEQLEIRDRWGKRIWSTSDYRRGWDGKIDGQDADVATYYYILRYKCTRDGKTYIKKGDINLIR